MIIDAKSKETQKILFNSVKARGCSKTNMTIAMLEAYYQSMITGEPVELNFEMVPVEVDKL